MTTGFIRRRTTIPVGRRLFLGVLPTLLAVLLAVGLAYYGEYGREAPGVIVLGAAVLAVASLIVTWINTRYLSARIRHGTTQSGDAGRQVARVDPRDDERRDREHGGA